MVQIRQKWLKIEEEKEEEKIINSSKRFEMVEHGGKLQNKKKCLKQSNCFKMIESGKKTKQKTVKNG